MSESLRRLGRRGLVDPKTHQPNLDRSSTFFAEALSFCWPARRLTSGTGLALSISAFDLKKNSTPLMVWPCSNQRVEGVLIQPLWPELPELARQSRDLHEFFSCVEVLRFPKHKARRWALRRMGEFFGKFTAVRTQNFPEPDPHFPELSNADFDQLMSWICKSGFKSMSLHLGSFLTKRPVISFTQRWETDQAFRLWLVGKYQEQAFQFLRPFNDPQTSLNKGRLALALEAFLDTVEQEETFFRLQLWAYLEKEPALQEMCGRAQRHFYESVLSLFRRLGDEKNAQAPYRAFLFVSLWRVYANFIWVESKFLGDHLDFETVKKDLRDLIVQTVFEEL
ncbi:MAG: hypothetical protein ACK5Y2_12410 [Bdellovibrionales bacterium]